MCYSALVQQNAKKLARKFGAEIRDDLYEEVFSQRSDGDKLYLGRGIENAFLRDPSTPTEKRIAKLITQWHADQLSAAEAEIFKQKTRLEAAKKSLEAKVTKKAENDLRISTSKIEKLKKELKRHSNLNSTSDSDDRIFPMHYVSILTLDENGKKVVMPIRYHMRPHDKDENFDREFFGCYNARFDNLGRVPFWKSAIESRRGIMIATKFYENVDPKTYAKKNKLAKTELEKKNIVLCFEPDETEYMVIPVIWDIWKKKGSPALYSGALITDEPAPEVAATGHDRTPIFLKESAIDAWLNGAESLSAIKELLMDRQTVHYRHTLIGAA